MPLPFTGANSHCRTKCVGARQYFLPASIYSNLRMSQRVFVVIQDAKSGKNVAYLAPMTTSEGQGTSALLITDDGERVQSLRVADLGETFIYEPTPVRKTKDVREPHKVQTLPIVSAKK